MRNTKTTCIDTKNDNVEQQQGFTILELMIATTIFSLVLLGALAGIMQITRMYYRGVTQIRTEETSRALADEIGEAVRFTKNSIVPTQGSDAGTLHHMCIGTKRYSYRIDRQLALDPDAGKQQSRHVLWVDQPANGCTSSTSPVNLNAENPSAEGTELLSEGMRLSRFDIRPLSGSDGLYSIGITVVFGASDLIRPPDSTNAFPTCETAFSGSEFCAVSNVNTIIGRRLQNE